MNLARWRGVVACAESPQTITSKLFILSLPRSFQTSKHCHNILLEYIVGRINRSKLTKCALPRLVLSAPGWSEIDRVDVHENTTRGLSSRGSARTLSWFALSRLSKFIGNWIEKRLPAFCDPVSTIFPDCKKLRLKHWLNKVIRTLEAEVFESSIAYHLCFDMWQKNDDEKPKRPYFFRRRSLAWERCIANNVNIEFVSLCYLTEGNGR